MTWTESSLMIHRPKSRREGLGRPHRRGKRRLRLPVRRAHAQQHVLVREHGRVALVGEWVGTDRHAGAADVVVAADMIRVRAGVDDETDRRG